MAVEEGENGSKKYPHLSFQIRYDQPLEIEGFRRLDVGSNVGIAHTQGRRPHDENAYCSVPIQFSYGGEEITAQFHGVFDGHGDKGKSAEFVAYYLPIRLEELLSQADQLDNKTITNALTQAIVELDANLLKAMKGHETTATCALTINNKIYIPNAGRFH